MKTSNSKTKFFSLRQKRGAALITTAVLTLSLAAAALLFTACPNAVQTPKPTPPPPTHMHTLTFSVEGMPANGELKATVGTSEIHSGKKVAQGATVTFTATPLNTYFVEKWTITGGTFKTGGKDGDTTATVQITGETAVKVSFARYKTIAFGTDGADLADYLNTGSPASDGIYYINITGLKAEHLEGQDAKPSRLGKILKDKSPKKVSLKWPKTVEGLAHMRNCFLGCENLVSVAVIPESVDNMNGCFKNCTKLTQAPPIPKNTKYMFRCFENCTSLTSVTLKCDYNTSGYFINAFNGCTALGEKSIKVPKAYYGNYTTADALNKMAVPGANTAEQRKKFEGIAELNP